MEESTLKLKKGTGTLEMFPGPSTLKTFECMLRFRSTFKYAASDFTSASKVLSLVFELSHPSDAFCVGTQNRK